MIAGIVIMLIIIISLSALWVHTIDRAVENEEWEKQRQKDREEEDREQERYLQEYTRRKQEKKKRKGRSHWKN